MPSARKIRTDSGVYNRPATIQQPATRTDDGEGGNSASGSWTTVCSPMVKLYGSATGSGSSRPFRFGQLYPTAKHWAEMRWRSDTPIDGTMTIVIEGRRFQILDAIDLNLEHVAIIMPLVEYQAQGTREVAP